MTSGTWNNTFLRTICKLSFPAEPIFILRQFWAFYLASLWPPIVWILWMYTCWINRILISCIRESNCYIWDYSISSSVQPFFPTLPFQKQNLKWSPHRNMDIQTRYVLPFLYTLWPSATKTRELGSSLLWIILDLNRGTQNGHFNRTWSFYLQKHPKKSSTQHSNDFYSISCQSMLRSLTGIQVYMVQ